MLVIVCSAGISLVLPLLMSQPLLRMLFSCLFLESKAGVLLISLSPAIGTLCACVLIRFSHVQLLAALWTIVTRLLCPWDSPGKNTGVGSHSLLQGGFPTQGLNPRLPWLLSCRRIFYCHRGSPMSTVNQTKSLTSAF